MGIKFLYLWLFYYVENYNFLCKKNDRYVIIKVGLKWYTVGRKKTY